MKKLGVMLILAVLFGCQRQTENPTFIDQYASITKENGWIFQLIIESMEQDENNNRSFHFDGTNMKHQSLEGIHMAVKDENGNEVGQGKVKIPHYSYVEAYRNELDKINSYFEQKNWKEKITIEDLSDLELEYFEKEDIVAVFHLAIQDETYKNQFGPYNIVESDCIQKKLSNGATLQLSFFNNYGYVRELNIEYLFPDGSYLSDKVVHKNANDLEVQAQLYLDRIEQEFLKTQTIQLTDVKSVDSNIQDEYEHSLNVLFEQAFLSTNR